MSLLSWQTHSQMNVSKVAFLCLVTCHPEPGEGATEVVIILKRLLRRHTEDAKGVIRPEGGGYCCQALSELTMLSALGTV